MNPPLRVLHILPGLAPGGTERFLERLLLALDTRVRSSVIVLKDEGSIGRALRARGIPVRALEIDGARALVDAIPHARAFAASEPPHVVQGWLAVGNTLASLVGHALHAPVCWNERNAGGALPFTWPTRIAEQLCAFLPRPDRVVCVSKGAAERMMHTHAKERVVVIENGYDDARFAFDVRARRDVRHALAIDDDDPVLVAVQRDSPEKDARTLLKAFGRVREHAPRARLLVVGPGNVDENGALTALIARADRPHVHLLGARDDVERVLAAADIFVSASRAEGVPNALAEALLVERVAVATDVGDARLLSCDGVRFVPPGNIEAFVQHVCAAIDEDTHARRERGRRARAHLVAHFSLARAAERYRALWTSLGST